MQSFFDDPAPPVDIRPHPKFGLSAFAAKHFVEAEIVLCEEPLLLSAPPKDRLVQQLYTVAQRAVPSSLAKLPMVRDFGAELLKPCAALVAFFRAPPSTQKHVLHNMHNQPVPNSHLATLTQQQAAVLAQVSPALRGQLLPASHPHDTDSAEYTEPKHPSEQAAADLLSSESIQKVLLAFELNAHTLVHPDGNRSALFKLGSKLTHTCGYPNTEYKSCQGKGYHVALRAIEPGELLTTCYLEYRKFTMATNARQRMLLDIFGFCCGCERCVSQVDDMRGLPCPHCATSASARKPDGTLPTDIALGDRQPPGLLLYDPNLLSSSSSSSNSCGGSEMITGGSSSSSSSGEVNRPANNSNPKPWKCNKCGVCLADNDADLFGGSSRMLDSLTGTSASSAAVQRVEDAVYTRVYGFDQQLDIEQVADSEQAMMVLMLAAKVVGANHWAVHYALLIHTEVLVAELGGAGRAVRVLGARAPAAMILRDVEHYVSEIEDDFLRTWSWLHDRTSLDAGRVLFTHLVYTAQGLMKAAMELSPLLRLPSAFGQASNALGPRICRLAKEMLERAAPYLRVYSDGNWPLPEPHPLSVSSMEARAMLLRMQSNVMLPSGSSSRSADSAQRARGGAAGMEQLTYSMQRLMELLPPASSHSVGAASARGGGSRPASAAGAGGGNKRKGKNNKHNRKR